MNDRQCKSCGVIQPIDQFRRCPNRRKPTWHRVCNKCQARQKADRLRASGRVQREYLSRNEIQAMARKCPVCGRLDQRAIGTRKMCSACRVDEIAPWAVVCRREERKIAGPVDVWKTRLSSAAAVLRSAPAAARERTGSDGGQLSRTWAAAIKMQRQRVITEADPWTKRIHNAQSLLRKRARKKQLA